MRSSQSSATTHHLDHSWWNLLSKLWKRPSIRPKAPFKTKTWSWLLPWWWLITTQAYQSFHPVSSKQIFSSSDHAAFGSPTKRCLQELCSSLESRTPLRPHSLRNNVSSRTRNREKPNAYYQWPSSSLTVMEFAPVDQAHADHQDINLVDEELVNWIKGIDKMNVWRPRTCHILPIQRIFKLPVSH